MLEWDGHWLRVGDQWFATVDPAVFLAGLHEEGSPQRMLTEQGIVPEAAQGSPHVLVWKSRSMIEQLARIIDEIDPRTIVELGIATGGSVALLGALAPQAKVVAIEIDPVPAPHLVNHIAHWDLAHRLHPHFGVDQANRDALRTILADDLGDAPLDLVIDDASHRLDLTRRSFEILYPRMRPGGCYIIEDWAWAHYDIADVIPEAAVPGGPPLTVLICELLMSLGTSNGPIDRLEVRDTVRVWRGEAELDRESWTLAQSIRTSQPVVAPTAYA